MCVWFLCAHFCVCLGVWHRAISLSYSTWWRVTHVDSQCPTPTLFLLHLSYSSISPSHTQSLNFSLGLGVRPSGLFPLHQSSHYLSFSVTYSDRLAISSWHLDSLLFLPRSFYFIAYSLSLHFCSSSLISYLPFNPYSHLLTVWRSGSRAYSLVCLPFHLCCCLRHHWIVLCLCFSPFFLTHISIVNSHDSNYLITSTCTDTHACIQCISLQYVHQLITHPVEPSVGSRAVARILSQLRNLTSN